MAASAANDKFVDGDMSAATAAGRVTGRSLTVQRLSLTDFRCYTYARVETDARPVVLTGPNGAGKTNILEALSYLVPGRGLRGVRLSEIGRSEPGADSAVPRGWAVAAKLLAGEDPLDVGTGLELDENDSQRERRVIKVDSNPVKNQTELGRRTSALWLTPQMDRLFQEGASGRRKFVDRLIYGLDPEHAGPVAAYEHSLRSRNKVLKDAQGGGALDAAWLDSIEDSMARYGVAVALRRLDAVARLHEISEADEGPFPGAKLALAGEMEELVAGIPALEAEDGFRRRLRDARGKDQSLGATSIGPHRSDLEVVHSAGGMPAELCSTGEQKALLVRIVLAAAVLEARERGRMPLLLLDEIGAHLDAGRRAALFDILCAMGAQAWMSGTDDQIFDALGDRGQFFHVKDARIEKR
ncbi:MAG: DNA replication/repair protein RecF [Rhodospirillaceae bacterium]